jgi:hypothetical protein
MYEVKANSKKRVRATQACVHCRKKKVIIKKNKKKNKVYRNWT